MRLQRWMQVCSTTWSCERRSRTIRSADGIRTERCPRSVAWGLWRSCCSRSFPSAFAIYRLRALGFGLLGAAEMLPLQSRVAGLRPASLQRVHRMHTLYILEACTRPSDIRS